MTDGARNVRVGSAGDGTLTYLVDRPPGALPPVRARDLEAAWDDARAAATEGAWGPARLFRFRRDGDDAPIDLALFDQDACCWAQAIDARTGLRSQYGLSLFLRLLALVDLLGRMPWARARCRFARDGAAIDPGVLRVAATAPLTAEARFDDAAFHAALAPHLPPPAAPIRAIA